MTSSCPSCGSADLGNFMCHYCGGPLFPLTGEDEQRRALDELHARVTTTRASRGRHAIFENGFLPDHPRVLIDAGLRMVPVLEQNVAEGPAAGRMRAIILKLKLLPQDAAAAAAAAELEAHLMRYERHDRLIGQLTIAVSVLLVAASALCLSGFVGAWLLGYV